jgi:hypothetical protein
MNFFEILIVLDNVKISHLSGAFFGILIAASCGELFRFKVGVNFGRKCSMFAG